MIEMYDRNYIYNMTTKIMNRSVQSHPFHLVEASPWQIAVSFSLLVVTLSGVMTFQGYSNGLFLLTLGFISLVSTMTLWFKDISREGMKIIYKVSGMHSVPGTRVSGPSAFYKFNYMLETP